MARGRMLSKSISLSMKMQALPDDTCRLLATWTIAHLDKRGVFYGDPVVVKSLILPMRSDVTALQVQGYMAAMEKAGLIVTFESVGRRWQCWPGFAAHQTGLRDERESTEFPEPIRLSAESAQDGPVSNAGSLPETIRQDSGKKPVEGEDKVEVEVEVEDKKAEAGASAAPQQSSSASAAPSEPDAPKTKGRPRDLLFDAIAEVTVSNAQLLGPRIAKCAKELRKVNATPDQVRQVAGWYEKNDWRGKKGEKLTFAALIEVWESGLANKPAANGKRQPVGESAGDAAIRMVLEKHANGKSG